MANLKDFFNKVLNDNRIYTREDIGGMSGDEFSLNEKAIDYQMENLGVPANSDLAQSSDVVYVHEYTRDDGTKVKAHYRSKHGRMAKNSENKNVLSNEIEAVTGGAASIENQKADFSEYAKKNPFVKINMQENANRPDAQEMANIYLVKPENAPKSNEFSYVKPGLAEVLNAKYNLTGNKKIDSNWPGIAYSENSTLSHNASNSKEMQDQIRKQFNPKTGKFVSDKLEINFTQNSNLHLSVGHGTILNPQIDNDGNFSGLLYDKYDFDPFYYNYYKDFKMTTANNLFYMLGGIKAAQSYYVLTPIKFKW